MGCVPTLPRSGQGALRWCGWRRRCTGLAQSVLAFSGRLRYQATMTRETIDQLARRLFDSMPQSVKSVREDVEKNFRSVLSSGLSRMDLVTREEFDVQQAVLARTRAKLEALEARLAALEAPAKTATRKTAKKSTKKKAAKTSSRKASKKKKRKAASKKT